MAAVFIAYVFIGQLISSPIFHASSYQKQLNVDKKADFYAEKETEIFNNKKRLPTIEERIEILKSVKIKIKTIVKREFDK